MIWLISGLYSFFWLMAAHALCDYALQSDGMIQRKNPKGGMYLESYGPWWWTMSAHSLINGAGVALVTDSTLLGLVECVIHFTLDTLKCKGVINTYADQYCHVASKLGYAAVLVISSMGQGQV